MFSFELSKLKKTKKKKRTELYEEDAKAKWQQITNFMLRKDGLQPHNDVVNLLVNAKYIEYKNPASSQGLLGIMPS